MSSYHRPVVLGSVFILQRQVGNGAGDTPAGAVGAAEGRSSASAGAVETDVFRFEKAPLNTAPPPPSSSSLRPLHATAPSTWSKCFGVQLASQPIAPLCVSASTEETKTLAIQSKGTLSAAEAPPAAQSTRDVFAEIGVRVSSLFSLSLIHGTCAHNIDALILRSVVWFWFCIRAECLQCSCGACIRSFLLACRFVCADASSHHG